MRRVGWPNGGRARWLAIFTLLLLVISAAPVLADPTAEVSAPPPVSSDIEEMLPDAQDIREGIEAFEREKAAKEDWLASAEAAQLSRTRFHGDPDLPPI
jgi:hypothetical protein